MKSRTVRIFGEDWTLRFARLKAICGDCRNETKTIRIAQGMSSELELDTVIHECLHAAGWHIDEEFVGRFATDVAKILAELGYRKDTSA
jgi:hypothetical protein